MKKILFAALMLSLCFFGIACGDDDKDKDKDNCVAQSDSAFCGTRECGSYTAQDNCGDSRTVNCGSCDTGYSCNPSNICIADGDDSGTCDDDLSEYSGANISGEADLYDYSDDGDGSWLDFFDDSDSLYVGLYWDDAPATFSNRTIDDWDDFESDYYSNTYIDDEDGYVECYSYNCVLIMTDETDFEVFSGKLTVNSVSGTFSGSLADAYFVDLNTMEYTLDDDGYINALTSYCLTPKISFSFSGEIFD